MAPGSLWANGGEAETNKHGEWGRVKDGDLGGRGRQTNPGGGGELLCDKDYWDKNLVKKGGNSRERNGRCAGRSGFGVGLI